MLGSLRSIDPVRRRLILVVAAVLLIIGAWLLLERWQKPPDIVLLVVDSLRADHVSAWGHEQKTTPHIDALARDGVRYRRAIAHAPWTAPSIAALMTSRYPGEFGFRHHRDPVALPDDATTMAEILADAGYSTRAIVSHIYAGSLVGLDQGFDSIDETHARGHDYVSSPHLVQAAAGILSSTDADPLFLYVHWFDPHYTYIGHREFTYPSDYDGAITDVLTQDSLLAVVDQLTDDDLQQVRRIYDSEIALTDQYIGALIDHLKSSGRYDDALVIVVADHGEEFNDHGRGWIGHSTSVEPAQIHVPLVIKYPGNVHAGESYDEWVGLVDVLPTVLEQAGVRPADLKSFRGASLLPAGRHAAPVFAEVYTESEHFQAAITGGFQMILDRRRNARSYRDLARDPTGRTEGLRDGSGTYNLLLQQLKNFDSQIEDAAPAGRRRSVNLSPAEALKLKSLGYLQ